MPRLSASEWTQSSPRAAATAALIGCALTIVMTWPTAPSLGTKGRVDQGDGRFSIWNVGWVAHALVADPRHLFDANIFHPHRNTLTYSELNLAAGAVAVPVYAATGNAVAAHNSAVLLALFGSFMATWALVRRLTGSFIAGILAAAGYTFSAYTAAHTAHIQLLMVFGFPLVMLAFHRLVDRPSVMKGAALGAAMGVTALASGYYGVFAVPLVGLATLLWARQTPQYWMAIAAAAAMMALVVLPIYIPFLRARAADGVTSPSSPQQIEQYSAHWRHYVTSGSIVDRAVLSRLVTGPRPNETEVLFPGFVLAALALAGVGASLARRTDTRTVLAYGVIAIAAAWASFGPSGGLYSVMSSAVPGISLLRAPVRLGVVTLFAVAVLAGFGARLFRPWVAALLAAVVVAELFVPWPLRAISKEPRPYQVLRDLPRGGAIEFPFPYNRREYYEHTKAMLRSTTNWQPLVNGYSDFTPDDFYEIAEPVNSFPDARSFEILRRRQVRYVLLRLGDYGQYRQVMLDRFPPFQQHLRLLADEGDVRLYEIVSWPEGMPR